MTSKKEQFVLFLLIYKSILHVCPFIKFKIKSFFHKKRGKKRATCILHLKNEKITTIKILIIKKKSLRFSDEIIIFKQ